LGFLEDRFSLPSLFRLSVQLLLASVAVGLFMGLPDSISKILIFLFLAVFITATTNIYNFMDGINGIAAVTGITGFILFAVFLALYNMPYNNYLFSISLMCACLGFLPFNMPKAKIFMGDTGSILLGFVFSSMIVSFSKSFTDFICLSSFLFPFYSDEVTTMYIRLRNRENLLHPHRQHLYQLLANEFKIPHWKISITYGVIQFFAGFSILLLKPWGTAILIPLIIYFLIFCFISVHVRRILKERRKL
jgi:Fuc2NAc and GlcNAc transferase